MSRVDRWGVGVVACSVAVIWSYLFLPLWYDEAQTIIFFASRSFGTIVTDYHLPNNHVAFSLLLHVWGLVLGDPEMLRPDVWILRVPTLIVSSAGIAAFYLFARRAISPRPRVAALATLFYAAQPPVLEFSYQLRGYGLSIGLFSIALATAVSPRRLPNWARALILGASLFLVIYAIPSNVWFAAPFMLGLCLLTASQARDARAAMSPAPPAAPPRRFNPDLAWTTGPVAGAVALAWLAYWPILPQLAKTSGMSSHSPANMLQGLANGFLPHALRLARSIGFANHPWANVILALWGCLLTWIEAPRRREARALALLVGPAVVLAPPAAAMTGAVGFSRNYVPGVPFLAAMQFWALARTGELALEGIRRAACPSRALVLARALSVVGFAGACACAIATHRATYRADFHPDRVMKYLVEVTRPTDLVIVGDDDAAALNYYAWSYGVNRTVSGRRFRREVNYRDVHNREEILGRLDRFYLVVSDVSLDVILKAWRLEADKPKLKLCKDFGLFKVYEWRRAPAS